MLLPNKKSASSIAVFFMLSLMLVLQPQYAVADSDGPSNTTVMLGVAGAAGLIGAVLAALNLSHHYNQQSENDSPGLLATVKVTSSATNISTSDIDTVTLTATALDGSGNPIPDLIINWSATSVAGAFGMIEFPNGKTTGSSTTSSNGVATITVTGQTEGNVDITATCGGITSNIVTLSVKPEPYTIGITPYPATATTTIAGGDTKLMLIATVSGSDGKPLPDITIDWSTETVKGNTGTATIPESSTKTESDGTTINTVYGEVQGSVTIVATATSPTTNQPIVGKIILNIGSPGKLDHITVTPHPVTIEKSGDTTPFTATAYDSSDNPIPNVAITWTAVTVGTGTATFPNGTATETATTGTDGTTIIQATGKKVGTVTITATSGSVHGEATLSVGTPGNFDHIGVTASPTAIASGGTATLTATAYDANGNIIVNASTPITVNWSAASTTSSTGTATLSATATTIGSDGTTTITATGVLMGSVTITAASDGVTSGTTTLNINSPGTFTTLTITPHAGNIASEGTITFTATAYDNSGNPIKDLQHIAVHWTSSSTSGGSITPESSTSEIIDGQTEIAITGRHMGIVTINASTGSISDSVQLAITSPGPAYSINITPKHTNVASKADAVFTATAYDVNGNQIPNPEITWNTTPGTGTATINAASPPTTATVTGGTVGEVTITATLGSAKGEATLTVTPDIASIAVTFDHPEISSGGTTTATATVLDSSDNPVPDINITWSASSTQASFGSSLPTDASGRTTSTVSNIKTAGSVTITAATGGKTGTAQLSVVPGAPATITLTLGSATITSDSSTTATATVFDSNGNHVLAGVSVAWLASSGSHATFNPSPSTTNPSGVATSIVSDTVAETITFTATSGSASCNTVTLTVNPGAASTITLTLGSATITSDSSTTATATVRDGHGNHVLAGVSVAWLASSGSHATFNPSPSTTNSSGVATSTVSDTVAETITFTATSGSASCNTVTLTVNPGAASTITLTLGSATITSDSSTTATATVIDGHGNHVLAGVSVAWLASSGSHATFNPSPSTTNSSGVATSTVTDTHAETGITITATSGSASCNTVTLTVNPGAASTITLTLGSATITSDSSTTATATVRDGHGNHVLAGVDVAWLASSGSHATFNPSPSTTNSSGVATSTVSDTVAETITFTATSGSASCNTVTLTVNPGTPAMIEITNTPPITINFFQSTPVYANAYDIYNNPIMFGYTITWTSSEPSVARFPTPDAQITGGVSTNHIHGVTPGESNITAAYGSVTSTGILIEVT